MVELVLNEISSSLEKGETVKLASFGSFIVRTKISVLAATRKPALRRRFRRVA
jgi:nucleoid DNA-binding protein